MKDIILEDLIELDVNNAMVTTTWKKVTFVALVCTSVCVSAETPNITM